MPVVTEPANIFLDGVDVVFIFGFGVGVVKAEMTAPCVFLCGAEVEVNGFSVTDMQIAVGFGGEACDDGFYFSGSKIVFDDFVNKMSGGFFCHILFRFVCKSYGLFR